MGAMERSYQVLAQSEAALRRLGKIVGALDQRAMDEPSKIEPLILCPDCKIEMRLFGIEGERSPRPLQL